MAPLDTDLRAAITLIANCQVLQDAEGQLKIVLHAYELIIRENVDMPGGFVIELWGDEASGVANVSGFSYNTSPMHDRLCCLYAANELACLLQVVKLIKTITFLAGI